jgi:hypothetical protein
MRNAIKVRLHLCKIRGVHFQNVAMRVLGKCTTLIGYFGVGSSLYWYARKIYVCTKTTRKAHLGERRQQAAFTWIMCRTHCALRNASGYSPGGTRPAHRINHRQSTVRMTGRTQHDSVTSAHARASGSHQNNQISSCF